ncbi:toll/interleukin-1 receptor domain-containing protein [Hydrogenophaga sp.]|uniref:toll/interleukin-1 receptor domain-containing protein n=1 Tax=Hydrogenophaga sp. TaxID=1904254 RepID=UPI003D0C151C
MDGIFISYRRDDSAGYAGRLYDRLVPHFGAHRVFMDVEGIELGTDFVTAIEEAVGSCRVLVVIIGDEWLTTTDAAGRRRLDDPHDFIRLETVTALQRGIRVVPVLVGGALMPRAEELPEDLKPLARRQAIEISHKQWEATTAQLIQALEGILSNGAAVPVPSPDPPEPPDGDPGWWQRWRRPATLAGASLCVLGATWWLLAGRGGDDRSTQASRETLLTAEAPPEHAAAAPVAATTARPQGPTPAPAAAPAPAPAPAPRPEPPSIRAFQAQADPAGVRLCYSVTLVDQLTLAPRPGALPVGARVAKDCVSVALDETTTFTLTARNAEATVRKTLTVPARRLPATTPAPEVAARPPAVPAPETAASAADAGKPRVGESWTYRTSGKWPTSPKRSIVIAVQSVANDVITEGLRAEGLASDVRRSAGARPMFMSWSEIGNEFSPYLGAYADLDRLGTLRGFSTPDVLPNWSQWYSEAKVVGQESVTVPAGRFQAHKVEVWSSRSPSGGPTMANMEPVRIHYLIWYAPTVKRYVKMQRRVLYASGTEAERDLFELVAHR